MMRPTTVELDKRELTADLHGERAIFIDILPLSHIFGHMPCLGALGQVTF